MRLLLIPAALACLAGCARPEAPPPPVVRGPLTQICPPSPDPASGYVCSPSKLCTGNDQMEELNNSILGSLLPQKMRNFLYHQGLAVDDLCAP